MIQNESCLYVYESFIYQIEGFAMPIVALTPTLVKEVVCPPNVKKYDLFDSKCKGLMLEVRKTGARPTI